METRPLGASDLEVSALSLGSWRTFEGIPREQGVAVMTAAREAGIAFLDDARYDDETGRAPIVTGYSEVVFGELFRKVAMSRFARTLGVLLRSGVPVVPAAIEGTYEALAGRRFYMPRKQPLSVRFGEPMHFGRLRHRRVTHAEREEITRRIMSQIAALLDAGPVPAAAGRAGAS